MTATAAATSQRLCCRSCCRLANSIFLPSGRRSGLPALVNLDDCVRTLERIRAGPTVVVAELERVALQHVDAQVRGVLSGEPLGALVRVQGEGEVAEERGAA